MIKRPVCKEVGQDMIGYNMMAMVVTMMMVMMGMLAELPNQTPTKIPIRATLRWGCWAKIRSG